MNNNNNNKFSLNSGASESGSSGGSDSKNRGQNVLNVNNESHFPENVGHKIIMKIITAKLMMTTIATDDNN